MINLLEKDPYSLHPDLPNPIFLATFIGDRSHILPPDSIISQNN
jgi:hypothetical protein